LPLIERRHNDQTAQLSLERRTVSHGACRGQNPVAEAY
jgi:hypothetical protein